MERKHRRMTEGLLCIFSLPQGVDKSIFLDAVDRSLEEMNCGRILGSGMSLAGDGTITVEIGAYDLDLASEVIDETCHKLKCYDYEMTWD